MHRKCIFAYFLFWKFTVLKFRVIVTVVYKFYEKFYIKDIGRCNFDVKKLRRQPVKLRKNFS